MAQRVLGLDLGAHTVKIAEVEVGFRVAKLIHLQTIGVPFGPEPPLQRSIEALRAFSGVESNIDMVALGVPGDIYLTRVLGIPISDPRKLGAVVAHELADDLPWEMEDVVFDHAALPSAKVLAVAARSVDVGALLEHLSSLGIDPRTLPPAAVSYGRLMRNVNPDGSAMVLDLGHRRTNICFLVDGRPVMGRTISWGGHQINEAFRQTFQLSYQDAEALKEREAFVALDPQEKLDPERKVYASVTMDALAPLSREIQMTVGAFNQHMNHGINRVFICGGTGLLRGIDDFLEDRLGVPCERFSLAGTEEFDASSVNVEGQMMGALSMGICLEQGGRQGLDLRQGEYAYQTDTSLFREKMLAVAVSVLMILVFMSANAFSSLYALRKEEKALKVQLKRATKEVFGQAVLNPRKVSRRVKKGSRVTNSGIPAKTAFDILNLLSTLIPGGKKVKLDILHMDIKPGKTYLKGTADSRSEIGDIAKSLDTEECFAKVTSGKISGVADEKKQFTLTITTKCF